MDEFPEVDHPRRRWQLVVVAAILVTLVGAVVWERTNALGLAPPASAAASQDPLPVSIALVKIGTATLFVKTVQGLTIGSKTPGTGLTFTRGLTSDTFFVDWMKQLRSIGTTAARRNITITFLDSALHAVRKVNVTGAVPVSLSLSPIDTTNPVQEILKLSYTDIAPA